jgi:tetratricopeptide (TPR) repeat protein
MSKDVLLHKELKEKYYHSRGALLCEEGKFDQAIRFLKKALAIDDQAFSHADLSLAYFGKGDVKRAIVEISKALVLCPSSAQYLLQRSELWGRMGDSAKADEDYKAALKIDPALRRIESIKKALAVIEEAFSGEFDFEQREIHNPHLSRIIREKAENRKKRFDAVDCQSCIVPCPAYCCHFSKDTLLHGLFFGAWKLQAVRRYLKGKGLEEKNHLAQISISDSDRRLQLIPPDRMLSEAGQIRVYFPTRSRKPLGQRLAKKKPISRGYSEISWITKESRACAFLSEGKCIIHNEGGDPALSSCKEFLCLTGFIFLVLDCIGVLDRKAFEGKDISELNNIAIEAALILANRIFDEDGLKTVEKDMNNILEQAMRADASGDEAKCDEIIEYYWQIQKNYAAREAHQIEMLRNDIRLLLVY